MAKYTVELGKLVQAGFNPFDDSWSTFVPEHKTELCAKIIRHYNFYEIGSETPDRFKFYLNEHLARIMPYYNQLYASELLKIEPLYNMVYKLGRERKKDVDSSSYNFTRTELNELRDIARSLQKLYDSTKERESTGSEKGENSWREHTAGDKDTDTTGSEHVTTSGSEHTDTEDTTQTEGESHTTTSEEMTDNVTGNQTSTGHEGMSENGTKRYSDTPQGSVGTSAVQIDKSYLTNYTATTGSRDTDTTSSTDTTSNETKKTDGTSDTTTKGSEDKTGSSDTKTTGESDANKSGTENIEYSEDKTGGGDDTRDTTEKEGEGFESRDRHFENSVEKRGSGSVTGANTEEKIGEKESDDFTYKGYTVPQAELLMQFRQTFINVDELIINALANNFMGVF